MNDTSYVEVSNDYQPGYYDEGYDDDPWSSGTIAGYGDIKTEVIGELADRVRARAHAEGGTVYIVEHHWDSGYCVTCSSEEIDFRVFIDDTLVYSSQFYGYGSDEQGPEALNNIAEFNAWLNGGDK